MSWYLSNILALESSLHFSEIVGRPLENRTLSVETAIANALKFIEIRIDQRDPVAWDETRSALRSAAALLCRSANTTNEVIAQFVRLPFTIFTKQSIKFGVLLWLGVINENPHMEPRLVTEIIENWIDSANRKLGVFSDRME